MGRGLPPLALSRVTNMGKKVQQIPTPAPEGAEWIEAYRRWHWDEQE
jgi:hypothetical protein